MATIDPSIALGVKPLQLDNPMNAMAMYSQIQGAQQANELNRMKMAEYERARAEEEGIRNYLAGGADLSAPETRASLLKYGKTGLEYGKALTEQDKMRTELNEKRVKLATDKTALFRDALADVNTPQQAAAWIAAQHQDPDLKPIVSSLRPLDQALAAIPTDPKAFADWKAKNALGMSKFIERNTMTAYEKERIGQENQRLAQEAKTGVYQQDDQGRMVWLPSKLNAGEVPKARLVIAPGAGMTPLEGKPSEAVAKERGSINQQKAIISGALTELKNNPDAFGTGRGMLGSVVGESAAGKMYETPEETQARAFIFNTVSNVIHERAGTAQSAGERDTLMRFLPSEYDNAKQIENKLKGYEKWLASKEAGTGHRKSEATKPPAGKGDGVDLSNPLLK